MRFQTRLAIFIAALLAFTLAVTGAISLRFLEQRETEHLGLKLTAVAAEGALAVDVAAHNRVTATAGADVEAYQAVKRQLKAIKASSPVPLKQVYTYLPGSSTAEVRIAVDSDENPATSAKYGETYDTTDSPAMREAFNAPAADDSLNTDKWGMWLSGYAPIKNANGDTIAVLGVDAPASEVAEARSKALKLVLTVLVAGLALAFPLSWLISRRLTKPVTSLVGVAEAIGEGDMNPAMPKLPKDEFGRLGQAFQAMLKGLRERDHLKTSLSRYFSRHVAEKIMREPVSFLKPERRHVSVMFTDLRGFTSMSESMSPEAVLETLNQQFEVLIEEVFAKDGTLDKFLGDGMMAVFGAPVSTGDDAANAVRAAVAMQRRIAELNGRRAAKGLPELRVGIGIHTGTVVACNVGSEKRLEYSVIGDTVNTASRLQGLAEGGQVVISQNTYDSVKTLVGLAFTPLPPAQVKGKKEPIPVYLVSAA